MWSLLPPAPHPQPSPTPQRRPPRPARPDAPRQLALTSMRAASAPSRRYSPEPISHTFSVPDVVLMNLTCSRGRSPFGRVQQLAPAASGCTRVGDSRSALGRSHLEGLHLERGGFPCWSPCGSCTRREGRRPVKATASEDCIMSGSCKVTVRRIAWIDWIYGIARSRWTSLHRAACPTAV